MTTQMAITGSGSWFPDPVLTNDELCAAFNEFVARENRRRADDIAAGRAAPLKESSADFILNASGIAQRHVVDKTGIVDPERMCPNIPGRPDDELSVQAEMAVNAACKALADAGRAGEDIDHVILASSNLQRLYPSLGMEVQAAIGARGFAYDMVVGCSSATYPIQIACDALRAGHARAVLVVNPEIMTGHCNWKDRDSHFLFGDAATAVVIEPVERARPGAFEILSTRLMSRFSSNIRNNGGFLNRCDPAHQFDADKTFYQQGRKVFKDVIPLAEAFISEHLEQAGLSVGKVSRFWLHQANANMNRLISKRLLGRDATATEAPIILDRYGNTASCGSIIAFDHHHDDLPSGAIGLLCSFGAGYSIGSVIVRKR
jgi:beta-ketodecanoyl-[acyl-carrier-protein] synthase